MQLIRKILFRRRPTSAKNAKIRGLSTAELVGIIVIVGILGALGGTYITGLIGQSKTNTGTQNAASLTTTLASALAGGANVSTTAGPGNIDLTSATTAITALNTGVSVTTGPDTVIYRMNPAIANPASYVLDTAKTQFSFTPGSAP